MRLIFPALALSGCILLPLGGQAAPSPSPSPTAPLAGDEPPPFAEANASPGAADPAMTPVVAATPTPPGYDPEEDTFFDDARR